MAKQLNIDLNVKANTQQAQKAIMELQTTLSKISVGNISGIDPAKMKEASAAARELSVHLNNAFNAQTGNFDLSKLDKSLKTSSTNVTELSTKLLSAGATGQEAFVKLAQTIAAADRPVVTLNSKLTSLFTTLKNTARWQLSSSMLHGFIGAYQQAMGYVKDLNKSLTDIRIVTGKSIEDMTQFAAEANKAAKALNTTTNEYAKASLIFFQQGLSQEEVTKRAEVTVKMANAAGQSAQVVSEQLTAVWNNFYDGSKSLEYYADVMTALGAATASSTDEIAGGLEKFAAIGQTIGLSYEYAASALATITSNTRESEEVVGTALKTIFARIQGLQLGETLDDGVTLNKYSEALQKVGISIFDSNGELKKMDNILDELGSKWDILNKAQQVALAQTVAGVRQYNQLIALMNNWDSGDADSMQANLATAYGSEGTLQEQADIYAESWEAARDRVKASAQAIYEALLDDQFFIGLNNAISGLLDSISAVIDGMGGLKMILTGVLSFFLSSIAGKIVPAFNNIKHTILVLGQTAAQQSKAIASEMNQAIDSTLAKNGKVNQDGNVDINLTKSSEVQLQNAKELNIAKAKLQAVEKNLTAEEKQKAQQELAILQIHQQQTQEVADRITKLKQEKDAILDRAESMELSSFAKDTDKQASGEVQKNVNIYREAMYDTNADDAANDATVQYAIDQYMAAREAATQYNETQKILMETNAALDGTFRELGESIDFSNPIAEIQTLETAIKEQFGGAITDLSVRLEANAEAINTNGSSFTSFRNQIDLLVASMPEAVRESEEMKAALAELFKAKDADGLKKALAQVNAALKGSKLSAKDFEKTLKGINPKRFDDLKENANKTNRALKELKDAQEAVNRAVKKFKPEHKMTMVESVTKSTAALGQMAMAISGVRSLVDAWNNDDLTIGEKITTSLMSISMIVPGLIGSLSSLNSVFGLSTALEWGLVKAAEAHYAASVKNGAALTAEQLAKQAGISIDSAQMIILGAKVAALEAEAAAHGTNLAAMTAEELAEKLGIATDTAAIIISKMKAGATLQEAMAEAGLTAVKGTGIVATIAQTVANWALQASMSPILLITLLIVAAFIALAAIVMGVVAAITAATNAYNADAIAAEKAAEAAKNLGEAYKTAKQEYEDMIAAMENYQNAREGLDSLTKGTEKYQQALKEANRQALELINQYGLIEGQDYSWEGDELVINDKAMSRVRSAKEAEADNAYAASQMANAEAKRTQAVADQTALRREMRDDAGVGNGDQWWKGALDILAGVTVDALSMGMSGGMGTTAAIASVVNRADKANSYDAAIDKAVAEAQTNANLFDSKEFMAQELNLQDQDLIDALWANRDSIQELSADMQAASEYEKLAAQNSANEILNNNEVVQNSKNAEEVMAAGGNMYSIAYDDAYNKYLADAKDRGLFNTGTEASEKAFEDYAEKAGLNDLKNFKVTNYKGDGTVEYKYIDDQGQEQKAIATAEEIAATLAAAEAAEKLGASAENLVTVFNNLDASGRAYDQAMKDFLSTGDFENATQEEATSLTNLVDTSGDGTVDETEASTYLGTKFGGEDGILNDEEAKQYGYESAQAMIDSFYEEIQNIGEAWDSIELPDSLPGTKEMSLKTAQNFENAINDMKLGPAGEKAGKEFADGISDMVSGLSEEDQTKALEQLSTIDWSSWDAVDQASAIMKSFGKTIDTGSEKWIDYANSMRTATNAQPDFSALRTTLNSISAILNDLKFGAIISDENYQQLIKYNAAWADFFILQTDGSRKFIGNEKNMQAALRDSYQANYNALAEKRKYTGSINSETVDFLNNDSEVEKLAGGDGKDGLFRFGQGDLSTTTITDMGYEVRSGKVYDKSGAEVSQQDASNMVMANTRANWTETFMSNNGNMADALESLDYTPEQQAEIIAEAKAGNDERLKQMLSRLSELTGDDYDTVDAEFIAAEETLASSATSLTDLEQLSKDNAFSSETQQKALIGLASSYEECRDEVEDYNEALASGDQKKVEKAEKDLKKALRDSEWKKATKSIKGYYKEISNLNDAEEIAKKQQQMAEALNELFGTNITSSFVKENWKLFDEWANSTGDRATELALEIQAKAMMASTKASDVLRETVSEPIYVDIDGDGALDACNSIEDRWAGMKAILEANPITIGANGKADLTQLINALFDAGYTAQEVANYLASIGQTDVEITGFGDSIPLPPTDVTDPAWVNWWNTYMADGPDADIQVSGASVPSAGVADMSNYDSGGGGGGGGSKPKPAEKKKKTDVVDRYKEITDSLDDNAKAMDNASKAADGLYGMARIKNMEKVNTLLQKELTLLSRKRKEAAEYLKADKNALQEAATEAGLNFTFDADGDISNYTEQMSILYQQYSNLVDAANADGNATEDEQEAIDKVQEKIDKVKEAIEQYEETKDTLFEIDQSQIDKFNEYLSNNFEKINAKIELDIEFNEMDLKFIEHQLSKLENDVYGQAEAAAITGRQLGIYGDNLDTYTKGMAELDAAYANGEISQASYVEGMKSISDGLLENLDNIQELDEAMKEYYGNTISMAQEEISKYTDLMEHATTVLDHYQNLMELFGEKTNYSKMGDILGAKAQVSKDTYDASAATYNMFRGQADAAKKAFEDAQAAGVTGYALEVLEQQWFDAEAAANEAQDQMLEDAATWAEDMRAILENSLAGFAQELEDALTGKFGSFDALSTEMERASSLQEEYLTTTNKIYETNKMMRTAQKEIDKTTNQMAKRKLKEFINETAAMQEQGKLSQYELEVQQAKYDLLLAEIALKEAQNAKSTVRLQRDSEGNFGYVYTADQSAIDDAQQKFEDSQNALYNKGLDGANDYAQKYVETMSEMNDALAEANQKYLDGEFKDVDEYNDAIDRIRQYYYQKMEDYSELYQVALGTDSRVANESWSKAFGEMTLNTGQWKTDTEKYIGDSKKAFESFNAALKPMKDSLSGSAKSIKDITNESKKLKTALTEKDGVIDSLNQELTTVSQVTQAYAAQRTELDLLLKSYEDYAQAAAKKAESAAFDENVIAPGSEIALKKTAAWSADVGDADDYSDKSTGPNVNKGYTVLRWDTGKKNVLISDGAGSYGWVPISNLVGFDTGGYTGEWGSYGKMAMVHEKELILNPHDTENFLASMEFLHKILEVIDLQAMSSQLGGILSSPGMINSNASVIEQDVHIEAHFPNATNHSEIEEAFNNLINTASQYANRK